MKVVGIIGSSGFLGQHLLSFFSSHSKTIKVISFVGDIRKQKQTDRFVAKCALVINLAGANKEETDQEIIETNIVGTINVVNACYSHKKGFLTCVERKLTNDAFSVSKNVQKSVVSEYNKLGFQGFMMKLDPVIGPSRPIVYHNQWVKWIKDEKQILELLDVDDVCKWIFSFSDAFLTNGSFYVKEFEFWDPIRVSVKDLVSLLNGSAVENVSLEHAQKILKCNGMEKNI